MGPGNASAFQNLVPYVVQTRNYAFFTPCRQRTTLHLYIVSGGSQAAVVLQFPIEFPEAGYTDLQFTNCKM